MPAIQVDLWETMRTLFPHKARGPPRAAPAPTLPLQPHMQHAARTPARAPAGPRTLPPLPCSPAGALTSCCAAATASAAAARPR